MNKIIAKDISLDRGEKQLLKNISFSIASGEQVFLTGSAGSGKTSLAMALAGQTYVSGSIDSSYDSDSVFLPKTILVSQHFSFKNKFGLSEFYYQQRYNSYDSEDSLTLLEVINNESQDAAQVNKLIAIMHIEHRINAPLIQLSSGERKKLQLILAFLKPAQIMILDNPYIGLDVDSVTKLNLFIHELCNLGVTFILISDSSEIPNFITHVAEITQKQISFMPKAEYLSTQVDSNTSEITISYDAVKSLLMPITSLSGDEIVRMENVSIKYGEKTVLNQVNWLVEKGDKWLLSGHNGAGKSTLLSLVTGDNPQAYANQLFLFGKKRGSGETIWDIKRNIGYISPELHWNFTTNLSCLDTIISGFFDTPGLYGKANVEQTKIASEWLEVLNLDEYSNTKFGQVSHGTQRMLLLLRALVKNPPLFIFDEPCQGLDEFHTRQFTRLVDALFADSEHTIIYISHRSDQIPTCVNKKIRLVNGCVVND
ncbi:ATP-binding cassette domain-containing protein [Aquella oligotrophica]|uniref:ABC transporter n=1 Tax=Aquella oligotrophica TaxID=2067065 RepID=A0A2I7N766_9NEIS|nr:ATP-binding cassette domain-containing protein [Aquella oligotrophica]AUR52316.1 ABC transporter [Aquella oligotrophica]